jgi:gamma-glutamyl:cysteine ligase YbdK (ATP-grasp superfamily)
MRVEFGKARCRLHGGLSTGPKTESDRARTAEAQRRRWRAYREGCKGALPDPTVGNRIMGDEKLEKVIEKLAMSEKTTLVCERAPEGKIRVTSGS